MFAEPEHVEPDLIGQLDFLQQILEPPCALFTLVQSRGIDIAKSMQPEFHRVQNPFEIVFR